MKKALWPGSTAQAVDAAAASRARKSASPGPACSLRTPRPTNLSLKTLNETSSAADVLDRSFDLTRCDQHQLGSRENAAKHADAVVDAPGFDLFGPHATSFSGEQQSHILVNSSWTGPSIVLIHIPRES